jgi:hypothetical protein
MWRNRGLSLEQYSDLCARSPISAAFAPEVVQYYFSRIGARPRFIGLYDRSGSLVGAFPSLYRLVFPSAMHKRLLGKRAAKLGDFGQPEALFPVLPEARGLALNHLSPITSALLQGRVRQLAKKSLRRMAIAKERKHKKLSARARAFAQEGGATHFIDDLSPTEFADTYLDLFCRRWNYPVSDYQDVRAQIVALHPHLHGTLLTMKGEPVAAQLCCRHVNAHLYYVDFINAGVQKTDDNAISYGSIMMLLSLRHAENQAKTRGVPLRFSFGFTYSDSDYKAVWADPEPTFVAI